MGKKEKRLQKKTANKSSNITTSTPNKEDSQSSSGYKVSDQPSSNQFKDSKIYSGVDDTRSRCGNSSPNKEDSLSSSVGDQSSSNQFKDSEHSKVEKTRTSSRNIIHNKEDSQSSYGDEVNDPSSSNTFNKHARVNGRHRNSSPRNEERNRNWPSGNQSSSSFGKKGRNSKNYPMNSKDSTENGSIETPIKNYDGFKKEIEGEGNSSKKENQSSSMQDNYSTDSKYSNSSNCTPNRSCYRSFSKQKIFMRNDTDEKNDFCSYLISGEAENDSRVKEVEGNLFEVDEDYALAHCVAQDMNMGSGIAIEFRNRFNKVPELLSQHAKTGGLAILEKKGRFIYYLVTKSVSQGKPTYDSLWSSLCKLREHMKANNVKKLAMPRIGCGLDRLDWDVVWRMLKYLFRSEDSDILVCNFQPLKKGRKRCKKTKCYKGVKKSKLFMQQFFQKKSHQKK
ncbi:putative uncharacterized protein DDB_G0275317 isoform X2 [Harmonia axyridis]|uniref:putative uncharacterized protein DDB_G0275317 isoform X2 n=1 Tax=Harmonia axyridis TaxID=115357 RepID=UPI001E278092|nr:putative uncharacterized protein DDB_G0275317 isoform X2 [Harmonia axyridis]